MIKFFKHVNLVMKHKWKVFVLCCKCGLFWKGLVHDLSKFSYTELKESVKYYNGEYSPLGNCRRVNGYSLAWLHHKGRNKHHIDYWYDFENEVQIDMPYKYIVECVCDNVAACKCYKRKSYDAKQVLDYWYKEDIKKPMGDKTRKFITHVFEDLVSYGEKYVFNKKYMKKTYNEIVLKKSITK